ncbi:MAG: hypothetical protein N2749_01810 [Clostridia bacterium]|nr:hypothetical protein [Clostridia bacterium]
MIEVVGYVGSVVIAISLLMRNVYKLRIVNLIGAFLFVIYGYLISAPAVWSVNLFIVFVDLYYIYDLKRKPHLFKFVQLNYNDLIESFIYFHLDDILNYFPNITSIPLKDLSYYLIVRNFIIVGIFGYRHIDDSNIEICIDYISPYWRDFKNAVNFFKYVASQEKFKDKTFHVKSYNLSHSNYLIKIGFEKHSEGKFILKI